MSYPKTHPLQSLPHKEAQEIKKTQKREQIKNMLVNKFRIKYNVRADNENLDVIIR
jgi:hypothetical protein